MEDQAYKPTMIHKAQKHYVTIECDTQIILGPRFELVVVEGVPKTYRMKNNEPKIPKEFQRYNLTWITKVVQGNLLCGQALIMFDATIVIKKDA